MSEQYTDFRGTAVEPDAVVLYSARRGNESRMSEGIVEGIKRTRVNGRVYPMVIVQPTGRDTGNHARKTLKKVHVDINRVAVIGEAK